jgi:HPt (histidine-containing phosphotransfer) domain-containing protein
MSWPEIEGIDSVDARARWCGDVALFSMSLGQLLENFGNADRLAEELRRGGAEAAAQRVHKLRGSASALGAKTVFALAGELEAAYKAADAAAAADLLPRLTAAMTALRAHAAPVLEAAPRRAMPKAAGAGISRRELLRLDALLHRQDLAAVALFTSLSRELENLLGKVSHGRMRGHVENLRFDAAGEDLRSVLCRAREPC